MFNIIMQENHLYIDPFTINNKSNCFMFAFILFKNTNKSVSNNIVSNKLVSISKNHYICPIRIIKNSYGKAVCFWCSHFRR